MTGAEHFAEAERLLQVDANHHIAMHLVAVAQVHATLALAAFQQDAADAADRSAGAAKDFVIASLGSYPPRIQTVST